MRNLIVFGANSAIAEAVIKIYAKRGCKFYLYARNQDRLSSLVDDLKIRGATSVDFAFFDINNLEDHKNLIDHAFNALGKVDIVLLAHGTLPDQKACEIDCTTMLEELKTNAISTSSLLAHLANKIEKQRHGTIAVISSVAGDRGRQSNYVYGAAKSMVSTMLQGLRSRLYVFGVNVLDIKPGFVDTPMTAEFKKGILWVKPEVVAKSIVRSIEKNKYEIYAPYYWKFIMLIIRSIPESLFKRLRL